MQEEEEVEVGASEEGEEAAVVSEVSVEKIFTEFPDLVLSCHVKVYFCLSAST